MLKIVGLIIFLCSFVSCGKGIDSSSSNKFVSTDSLQPGTVSITSDEKNITIYDIESDGWATIPELVHITNGSAEYIITKISFNSESEEININTSSNENVICEYYSVKNNSSEYTHALNSCYYYNDGVKEELYYEAGQEIVLEENNFILISINASDDSENLKVQADIDIEWL